MQNPYGKIGDATGETTCVFSGTTFKITNVTKTESAEDVIKSSISGIFYGTTFTLS